MISGFDVAICHLPERTLFNTSFPMKVLEYLACDAPVLASDIPAHREISDKLTGITLYGPSVDEFLRAIHELMNNEHIRPKNLESYGWRYIAKRFCTYYRKLSRIETRDVKNTNTA
jgi:glycosyltransferase involved in cell wall biosynthesis